MKRRPRRRWTPKLLGVAVIGAVLVSSSLLNATADPAGPGDNEAEKEKLAQYGPCEPAPDFGECGSETYCSSAEEEADLQKASDLADSLDSLGSARTGVDSMLVRLPLGASVPKDTTVGTFTVHFEPSRFTAATLAQLSDEVSAIGEAAAAANETSSFGYGYEASEDLLVVHGTAPKSLIDLVNTRPSLSIAGDASAGDGRQNGTATRRADSMDANRAEN